MAKSKTIKVVDVEPEVPEAKASPLPISEPISEPIAEPEVPEAKASPLPISEPIVKLPKDANGAKAKRQPKAKKVVPIVEPEVTVESTLNESVVELKMPVELIKQLKLPSDKVKCPDCEKMVSSKSLKYSHKYTCISKKIQEHNDKKSPRKNIIGEKREELLNNDDVIGDKVYEPVEVVLPVKQNVSVKETARDMRQRLRQERLLNLFVNAV